MAASDPVEVVVEIIDGFSDELAELKGELESIDLTQINIDVDVDDDGDFENIKAQIEALRETVEANVDIDSRGFERVMAEKAALAKDVTTNVNFKSRGSPGFQSMIENMARSNLTSNFNNVPMFPSGVEGLDLTGGLGERMVGPEKKEEVLQKIKHGARTAQVASEAAFPGLDVGGGGGGPLSGIRGLDLAETARESRMGLVRLRRTMGRITPNIMDVWNALAALIPVFVTLGGAAIGLAGALGGIAAAGAAVVGLGLIGWGENLSESMKIAQQRAQALRDNLHGVLQPAAAQFEPILEGFMRGTPYQVQELVGPLQELTEFADTLGNIGAGFVDWVSLVITQMAAMQEQIDQIAGTFGQTFGAFLIELMSGLVDFTANNREEIVELAGALTNLIGILFDVSVAVAMVLAKLSPFIEILGAIADVLNNEVVVWLLSIAGLLVMLEGVIATVTSVTAAWAVMNGTLGASLAAVSLDIFEKYLPAIYSYITAVESARAATLRLLAVTGAGLALAGAGYLIGEALVGGGPDTAQQARRGGGAQQITNINVQGDVGRREMDRIVDRMPAEANTEYGTIQQQEGP